MSPLNPPAATSTTAALQALQGRFHESEQARLTLTQTVEQLTQCCHELQQEVRQKTLCVTALRETISTLD
eukprot:scaffold1565_cov221-Amphora_coffeaeformis.AAC.1